MSFFNKSGSRLKKQPPYIELLIHLNLIINFAKTDLYPLEAGNNIYIYGMFL